MDTETHLRPDDASSLGDRDDLKAVVKGNTAFALDLYAKLKDQEGNLFFSPYSISTALAMTYAGARGDTACQMADVLHFALAQAQLHPAFADLIGGMQASPEERGYQLTIANALWGQQGFGFLDEFLELTRAYYDAGLHKIDFETDPEAVRQTINEWVEHKTEKKIQDLIPPGLLDRLTRLVLTNAIYFKGAWTCPFRKDETQDELFTLLNGKQVIVPMMNQTEDFRYIENDTLQILKLPYVGEKLSMVVILPKQITGISELEQSLSLERLENFLNRLSDCYPCEVIVSIPKFEVTSEFSLADSLTSLGITDAFIPELADFSGMNGAKDLFIKAVIHKAFVEVNEEGTAAAAAAAVMMDLLSDSLPSEPKRFRADHPFLFLIRDTQTHSILFIGRMMNPNSQP